MLEPIFGGKNAEKALFFLLKNERCYGAELKRVFEEALSPFQKTLDRLESGGVIVSFLEGRTRSYQFNPRYPFLKELKAFLEKAYLFLPLKRWSEKEGFSDQFKTFKIATCNPLN